METEQRNEKEEEKKEEEESTLFFVLLFSPFSSSSSYSSLLPFFHLFFFLFFLYFSLFPSLDRNSNNSAILGVDSYDLWVNPKIVRFYASTDSWCDLNHLILWIESYELTATHTILTTLKWSSHHFKSNQCNIKPFFKILICFQHHLVFQKHPN